MDRRDRRGQLLLVAALGLAVAFVVLALVLNAVVFTENLATRNHGQTDDVVGYERGVEAGVGGLVAAVNHDNNTDYGALRAALDADVATWSANASVLSAATGRATDASVASVANGTQVVQSDRRAFANASGSGDWTAAVAVDATRRFHVVAAPSSSTDPLSVTATDGAGSWTVRVAENGTGTNVTVLENGSQVASYDHGAGAVELDVTEGTVNGTAVANWSFAAGVSAPYDLTVANGGNAEGRYVFVVDRPRTAMLDDLPQDTYHDRGDGESPTTAPAVFAASVSVSVLDDRVTYETQVSVAPESAPAGEDYALGGDPPELAPGIVFVDDDTGNVMRVTQSDRVVFDVTDAAVLGPARADLDGDARAEVPYVDGSGALRLVDANNRTVTWRTSASSNPPVGSASRLGLGRWQGGHRSVLYADDGRSAAYAAANDSEPSTLVHDSGNGVEAVAGVADVDGDGSDEFVFGDASQQLRYRDDDGTETEIPNGGYGKNGSVGVGPPADFDGDGTARVPFVDGGNDLRLVDGDGNVETIVSSSTGPDVDKAPVAVDDWDDDGDLEVLFTSGGDLWYADDVAAGGTAVEVTADLDGDGEAGVDVDTDTGLA